MKSSKLNKKLNKNLFSLRGVSLEIVTLLGQNPTTKYVTERLGKGSSFVGVYLKRLEMKGVIRRIDRGVWKVLNPTGVLDSKKDLTKQTKQNQNPQGEYYRVHSIEVRIVANDLNHRHIKNTIFNNPVDFNVRKTATGHYFDCVETCLLTKENLFIKYPKDFDITCKTKSEMYDKLNMTIISTIQKIQSKFKIQLYRECKINYYFHKLHIAHINNGIVKRIDESGHKVFVRDDDDGKLRFIMDRSKGTLEGEFIHPDKCFDDSNNMDETMKLVSEGKVIDAVNKCNTAEKEISNLTSCMVLQSNSITVISKEMTNLIKVVSGLVTLITPKDINPPQEYEPPEGKPDYIG